MADSLEVTAGDVVQLSFRLGAERHDARFRIEAVCGAFPGFPQFRTRVANRTGSGALVSMATFERMTAVACVTLVIPAPVSSPEPSFRAVFVPVEPTAEPLVTPVFWD